MRINLRTAVIIGFILSAVIGYSLNLYPQIILPHKITLVYYVMINNETVKLIYNENIYPMYRMDLYYPFKPGEVCINITVSGLKGSYSVYLYSEGKLYKYKNTSITIYIKHPYLALHIYLVLWKAYPTINNVKVKVSIRSD